MIFKLNFNTKQICIVFLFIFILIINSGCSDLRQAIGKEKYIPDEFSVMKTPSLVVPPGFGIVKDLFKKNNTLTDDKKITLSNKDTENKEFENLFNTTNVPNNIRQLVDEETLGLGLSERTGLDILFGNVPETGVVLDSAKESLRIKKNKEEKKSLLTDPSLSNNKVDGSILKIK